jgi:hypothetical protein
MRRRTAVALTLAAALGAALAAPPGAAAKGVVTLAVCGTNGCHAVDRAAVRAGVGDTELVAAPRRGEPFFTIRARAHEPNGAVEAWSLQWLPRARLLRGPGEVEGHVWSRPAPVLDGALRHAARGLRPHPAAALGALREPPPQARVVEVFAPADDASGSGGGPGGAAAAAAIAVAALFAGAGGALVRMRGRRRRVDGRAAALGPDAAG